MATLKETADFFGISFQALSEYVKKHLDELNFDGKHAVRHQGKWHFDEVAIQRLSEMRAAKENVAVPHSAKLQELTSEIAQLKMELENLQSQVEKITRAKSSGDSSDDNSDGNFFIWLQIILISGIISAAVALATMSFLR